MREKGFQIPHPAFHLAILLWGRRMPLEVLDSECLQSVFKFRADEFRVIVKKAFPAISRFVYP
jgi:hypothetical protein